MACSNFLALVTNLQRELERAKFAPGVLHSSVGDPLAKYLLNLGNYVQIRAECPHMNYQTWSKIQAAPFDVNWIGTFNVLTGMDWTNSNSLMQQLGENLMNMSYQMNFMCHCESRVLPSHPQVQAMRCAYRK